MSRSEVSGCLAHELDVVGEVRLCFLLLVEARGTLVHTDTTSILAMPKLVSVSSGSLAHELDDIQEVRTLGTRDPDHRQLGLALHGSSIAGEALHVYIYKGHSNKHNTTCSIQRHT